MTSAIPVRCCTKCELWSLARICMLSFYYSIFRVPLTKNFGAQSRQKIDKPFMKLQIILKYTVQLKNKMHQVKIISICDRTTCCPIWKSLDEENSEDCQIGRGRRPSAIWQSEEFFEFDCFQIGQHIVLLRVNYIVHEDTIWTVWKQLELAVT